MGAVPKVPLPPSQDLATVPPVTKGSLGRRFRSGLGRWLRIILEIITLVLSILAIAYEVKLHRIAGQLDQKTTGLLGTASTSYGQDFPLNLPVINKVLDGACETLDIMVDVPGYGVLSNPDAFQEYMGYITSFANRSIGENDKQQKCLGKREHTGATNSERGHVRMILFSPPERRVGLLMQLTDERFSKLKRNKNTFATFFSRHNQLLGGMSFEQYYKGMTLLSG